MSASGERTEDRRGESGGLMAWDDREGGREIESSALQCRLTRAGG